VALLPWYGRRHNGVQAGCPAAPPSPAAQAETEDYGDPTARVGAVLASKYKLVEAIGAGGMGSVFLAQQTEPVKRAVAVKAIKAGMDSKAVLPRFEAERQALALMDHPHIAKVLDAGSTDGGRPFFVMELVKGTPITRYCDEHKLTPRQRLELFVPVCQAIQHAHQKGIIHRGHQAVQRATDSPAQPGVMCHLIAQKGPWKASGSRNRFRTTWQAREAYIKRRQAGSWPS
jgi:hypothetical protein